MYYDSVKLLLLSKETGERAGIRRAMVAMATATNLEILSRLGWSAEDAEGAGDNDLLIAVEAEDGAVLDSTFEWLEGRLRERASAAAAAYRPRTRITLRPTWFRSPFRAPTLSARQDEPWRTAAT